MKYFICGFMGSGKSYQLEKLKSDERFFGYSFYDLDEEISKSEGEAELGELIIQNGFEWFRKKEFEVLKSIMNKDEDLWLSLGGGTVTHPKSLDFLKKFQGYWLNTPFSICFDRIKDDENRPLVSAGEEKLRDLYQEREKIYQIFDIYPFCNAE